MPEIQVEICSNCHPFFTGQDKIIDTAGRVERFKKRAAKATPERGVAKKAKAIAQKSRARKKEK